MNDKIFSVANITKSFELDDGKELKILDDISFDIEAGSVFGIMGESGAGKSTLLNVVSTIDSPDSGKILFDGKDILSFKGTEQDNFRNKSIGFIFQSHHLLAEFDVLANVMMPALIDNYSSKTSKKEALRLIKRVGLEDRARHAIKKLSGGEQQRVSIARALMNKPKLIFCDEPTGNLDHKNTMQIFDLFRDLSNELNITFVIVSHSELLKSYAKQMIYIEDGKVLPKI